MDTSRLYLFSVQRADRRITPRDYIREATKAAMSARRTE